MPAAPASAFVIENARLRGLGTLETVEVGTARQDLAPGLWLSVDPGRGALLLARSSGGQFCLSLPDAGQAAWVGMGISLDRNRLAQGRFVGLRDTTECNGFFCYRLCLRYLLRDGGLVDRFADDYAASSGGLRHCLTHVPVDPALLAQADATELHLFFQGPGFEVRFRGLDLLLMH